VSQIPLQRKKLRSFHSKVFWERNVLRRRQQESQKEESDERDELVLPPFAVDTYKMNWGTLNETGDIRSREEGCLISGCRKFLVEAFSISSIMTSDSSCLVEISNLHLHLQCTRPFLFI
ncbi:hypothetical protein TorRG33x02_164670, partial [Trema orientale]